VALSSKHCRTLCAIFEQPTRADIKWNGFMALYSALGGEKPRSGRTTGSRRRLKLHSVRAVLHSPHPQPEMKKGSVESVRDFLMRAGITPQSQGCRC
jgi:hypothetical protein